MTAARTEPLIASAPQRARVCRTLLALVGATERWTPSGPTPAARVSPPGNGDPDVQRILAACWAIWDGCSTLALADFLQLRPRRLETAGELLAAIARGPAAIEDWLARFEPVAGAAASARPSPSRRTDVVSG
jgi:hypothetical protein